MLIVFVLSAKIYSMLYQRLLNPEACLLMLFIFNAGCSTPYTATISYVELFTNSETHLGSIPFIVLRNGDTVFGKIKEPNFSKKIIVNGQTFIKKEVRYMYNWTSVFHWIGNGFGRRIITGKINVYTRTFLSGKIYYNVVYLQIGDQAEPVEAKTFDDYRKAVKDCPLALEMIEKGVTDLKKARMEKNSFLSTAILVYNKGCEPF